MHIAKAPNSPANTHETANLCVPPNRLWQAEWQAVGRSPQQRRGLGGESSQLELAL